MRTKLILLLITLVTLYTSAAGAEESNARVTEQNEAIEKVVVFGTNRCGSWPIEHDRLMGCEYEEIKKESLPMVLDHRQKLMSHCLICQDNMCTTRTWPEDWTTDRQICKTLFTTPTKILRFMKPSAPTTNVAEYDQNVDSLRDSLFRVSYTYRKSTAGKVEDIALLSFDGDIDEQELLQLIADGAAKTRFEPIIVDDVAYELVDLRDSYILDNSDVH